MSPKNYTAVLSIVVYWLKLVIGGIAFLKGNYQLAGSVLLIGSLLEILFYSFTMRK